MGDQSTPSARTQGELSPFEFYMYMLLGSLTTRAGSSLTFVLCALVFYVRYRRVHLCNSWILALVLSSDDDELSSRCLLLLFAVLLCVSVHLLAVSLQLLEVEVALGFIVRSRLLAQWLL